MFIRTLTFALAFGVLAAGPPAAHAQDLCVERARLVHNLERNYGETRKGAGLVARQTLFELWTSDQTGTWTIFATSPNGTSCIIAAGGYWQDERPAFAPVRRGE